MYEYRPEKRVTWLFSILDYHHYTLTIDGTDIGQLIVNPVDRSMSLRRYADGQDIDPKAYFTSYGNFERWLKFHREL